MEGGVGTRCLCKVQGTAISQGWLQPVSPVVTLALSVAGVYLEVTVEGGNDPRAVQFYHLSRSLQDPAHMVSYLIAVNVWR